MLFQSKNKKIEQYLQNKVAAYSAFDELLEDYLKGSLEKNLAQLGITKAECHIDWLRDYRCIGIQGKYCSYYVDLQIEETEFSIACDEDEPDNGREYTLETKAQMYSILEKTLNELG